MAMNPSTQYATDRNLASRQQLWSSSGRVPEFDLFSWVVDLADVTQGSTQSILDVGCGNGAYERALVQRGHRGPRVALDLSAGMLPLVNDAAPVLADVQALPFSRRCFDLVLAPHMLYHVPDIRGCSQGDSACPSPGRNARRNHEQRLEPPRTQSPRRSGRRHGLEDAPPVRPTLQHGGRSRAAVICVRVRGPPGLPSWSPGGDRRRGAGPVCSQRGRPLRIRGGGSLGRGRPTCP